MPDEMDVPPTIDAIEERLVKNHDEFVALGMEWKREWQKFLATERKRKQRAQQSSLAVDADEAA